MNQHPPKTMTPGTMNNDQIAVVKLPPAWQGDSQMPFPKHYRRINGVSRRTCQSISGRPVIYLDTLSNGRTGGRCY